MHGTRPGPRTSMSRSCTRLKRISDPSLRSRNKDGIRNADGPEKHMLVDSRLGHAMAPSFYQRPCLYLTYVLKNTDTILSQEIQARK